MTLYVEIKAAMFNFVTYDISRGHQIYIFVPSFYTKVLHQFFLFTQMEKSLGSEQKRYGRITGTRHFFISPKWMHTSRRQFFHFHQKPLCMVSTHRLHNY